MILDVFEYYFVQQIDKLCYIICLKDSKYIHSCILWKKTTYSCIDLRHGERKAISQNKHRAYLKQSFESWARGG